MGAPCIPHPPVADMVGHTGNLKAAIEAVTVTDECIKVGRGTRLCAAGRHAGAGRRSQELPFIGACLAMCCASVPPGGPG